MGFLPRNLVLQEKAGVDISHYRNRNMAAAHIVCQSILMEAITNQLPHLESLIIDLYGPDVDFSLWTRSQPLSDYLTSKIGGQHLRNICARTLQLQGPPNGAPRTGSTSPRAPSTTGAALTTQQSTL